jgi:hypothetical protein
VIVQNNIVVNNVIDIDIIQEKSKEKVVVYEEKPAESPEASGIAKGNAVTLFKPEVKEEPQAKPAKVKKAEDVAAKKKASGTLPEEPAVQKAAPAETTEPSSTEAEAPAAEKAQPKADQAGTEKKKQKPASQAAQEPEAAPEQGQTLTEEPTKKEKKKAVKTEEPAAEQQQAEQPVVKKQKGSEKALNQPEEAPQAAPVVEGEQVQKPEKKRGQKKQCDPAVEECAGQQ